ncbi:hypothetical protein YIM_15495 [Amycolatopsis sp. YIM 10]|nr:hypothetical protein YIM_15495 [Amycolatopsis sp. YIM 10]
MLDPQHPDGVFEVGPDLLDVAQQQQLAVAELTPQRAEVDRQHRVGRAPAVGQAPVNRGLRQPLQGVTRLDLTGEEGGEPGDAGVGEQSRWRAAPLGGPAELLAQLNEVRPDGVDQVEAGRQQRLQDGQRDRRGPVLPGALVPGVGRMPCTP